jgi:hypothetical protein
MIKKKEVEALLSERGLLGLACKASRQRRSHNRTSEDSAIAHAKQPSARLLRIDWFRTSPINGRRFLDIGQVV